MVSKRFSKLDFGPLSVDRATDCRQSKIVLSVDRAVDRYASKCLYALRSTEQSTDMHQSVFVHFGRPGGLLTARALLSIGPGRPTESLTLWLGTSTVGGRPAG